MRSIVYLDMKRENVTARTNKIWHALGCSLPPVEIISKPAENLIYISICKALCKSCVLQIHSTWSVSLNSKEEQALIDFIVMDFACNSCQEQVK